MSTHALVILIQAGGIAKEFADETSMRLLWIA